MSSIDTPIDNIVLILDSSIGQQTKVVSTEFLKLIKINNIFLTNVFKHKKGGGAILGITDINIPILFLEIGKHINALFEYIPSRLVNRILGKGDMEQELMLNLKGTSAENSEKFMTDQMKTKGTITFRALKKQIEAMNSLGSLGHLMQSIPCFADMGEEETNVNENTFEMFNIIFNNMTDEELDGDISIVRDSMEKKERICHDSKCEMSVLNELFATAQPFISVAKRMHDFGMIDKNGRIPEEHIQRLAYLMPPNVLNNVGGHRGFINLMNKFKNLEAKIWRQNLEVRKLKDGEHRCGECNNVSKNLLRCAGCKQSYYCNIECQRAQWKKHKKICKKLRKTQKEKEN
eukprot:515739_1